MRRCLPVSEACPSNRSKILELFSRIQNSILYTNFPISHLCFDASRDPQEDSPQTAGMTHRNGNNAFVPGIHSITAKVLSSLAPGSRALQVRVNAVVKRAAKHTEAGVHDECMKMIGTFIASEGEGRENNNEVKS